MPETPPRISALIIARDEAENLPGCLESLSWVDETIVVVDAASVDSTEAIARGLATRVVARAFDDFARQRNASLALASGDWVLAVDADERATPGLAIEVRRTIADRSLGHAGYRVPIRSVVLGRSFGHSGTQHDLPLRLFRRDLGRWVGTVHETVDLRGSSGRLLGHLSHRTIPDMHTFLRKIDHYTTLEAIKFHREGRPFRPIDLAARPIWTFLKLYLGKQGFRDGLEGLAFCALSGLSVAVRHWKLRELIRASQGDLEVTGSETPSTRPNLHHEGCVEGFRRSGLFCLPLPLGEGRGEGRGTTGGTRTQASPDVERPATSLTPGPSPGGRGRQKHASLGEIREFLPGEGVLTIPHDAFVAARFDESEGRFKAEVAPDDVRLRAVIESLGPLEGRRVLDLGCGKGRFAGHLQDAGAEVVGLDLSAAMLAGAAGLDRVRASARRLPFADGTFDAVVAIEVLEHVGAVEAVLAEARRVLKPGGRLAIVDKNAGALDANRPWLPGLVVKWVDERRGLWMYPAGGPVVERWFWPRSLARKIGRDFECVRLARLLRPEEARRRLFRMVPGARLMTLWSARVPGGGGHG